MWDRVMLLPVPPVMPAYGEKEMSQAVTVTRVPPMLMPEGWSRKFAPMWEMTEFAIATSTGVGAV